MSLKGKLVIVISLVWFAVSTVYFSHRHSIILQLLSMMLAFFFFAAFIIGLVCIFTEWRQRRWFALVPFVICIVSVVLPIEIVPRIREIIFQHCLPSYQAVIQRMQSGAIPVSTNLDDMPQAVPQARLADKVWACKDSDGTLSVIFWTESGFPAQHSGYIYVSSGVIKPGSREDISAPHRSEIQSNWFFFSF